MFYDFLSLHKKNLALVAVATTVIIVGGIYVYNLVLDHFLDEYVLSFDILVLQIQSALTVGLKNNYLTSQTLSQALAMNCPEVQNWPNCSVKSDQYLKIVSPLLQMGYLRDMSLVPIIKHPPKNLDGFESYAYNFFKSNPFYPLVTDLSNNAEGIVHGGGVYAISPETNERYHDTHGTTSFSKHNILTPVLEIFERGSMSSVMYNLHSEYHRGKAIDEVIDAWDIGIRNKSAVTSMVQLVQDTLQRPASMLFYPISPATNNSELVGFVRAVHDWDTVLLEAVPSGSASIQIVIDDGIQQATFIVSSDSAHFVGWGDVHDRTYDQYSKSYRPRDLSMGYHGFTFNMYPTEEFFPSSATWISSLTCAAVVLFVLLLTVAFLVHDTHLQGQLWEKQEALNLKQSFVRFISHEIRTPMNTVCIGLKLLLDEVNIALTDLQRELERRRVEPEQQVEMSTIEELPHVPEGSIDDNASLAGESKADSDANPMVPSSAKILTDLTAKIDFWYQLLREVEESSVNAVSILNELLSYDKIEQKTMTIEKELLPVWEIIGNAIKPFSIQARERSVGLTVQIEPFMDLLLPAEEGDSECNLFAHDSLKMDLKDLLVIGDSVRLAQVFRNVVSNALKYSSSGMQVAIKAVWCPQHLSKQGTAMIASIDSLQRPQYAARGAVRVTVEDNGPGLSAENLKKLFGQGMQHSVNKLQAGGGSGMELWIAKGIVDLHCGTISAASPGLGRGTTITVELPVVQRVQILRDPTINSENFSEVRPKEQQEVVVAPINKPTNSAIDHVALIDMDDIENAPPLKSLRTVLVVDDSGPTRKMICRMLKNFGCTHYEAEDGTDCVSIYAKSIEEGGPTFDLAEGDVERPEMLRVGDDDPSGEVMGV
eukprot:gene23365-31704_t